MVDDLAGAGKIAEVISNSIGKAIGSALEPWQIRRVGRANADVEAYAIEKRAEAELKASIVRGEYDKAVLALPVEDLDLRQRAGQRLITQEMTRQGNIEAIYSEATEYTRKAEQDGASPRSLDDDWICAFLDYAQDVSNEELQRIWAKILATQATEDAPTVSKATLDSLRLIEVSQAKMFERAIRLHLAMGQIMDVDPFDGFDVGYQSHMNDATALEDLGLLRRVRDIEPHLEIRDGVLTFWRDVHPGERVDEYVHWTDEQARGMFLELVLGVAKGQRRDHGRLRHSIRIDRQILTSRGFELAAIVIPEFNALAVDRNLDESLAKRPLLADFSSSEVRYSILKQWAVRISAQGAAVIFSEPFFRDIEGERGHGGTRRELEPKKIFNPETEQWETV